MLTHCTANDSMFWQGLLLNRAWEGCKLAWTLQPSAAQETQLSEAGRTLQNTLTCSHIMPSMLASLCQVRAAAVSI